NPALIPQPVYGLEHGRVVDLALVRFVPRWHRGALQMSDQGKKFLQPVDQIAAYDLHMVEIELHADVRFRGFFDNSGRMFDVIEKIVRSVPAVDRLDQQFDFFLGGDVGRLDEIVEIDAVRRRPLLGGNLAGETIDPAPPAFALPIHTPPYHSPPPLLS